MVDVSLGVFDAYFRLSYVQLCPGGLEKGLRFRVQHG